MSLVSYSGKGAEIKAGQWSNEQIVALFQEAARGEKPISTLCRVEGVSEPTFYSRRQKFRGMQTREVARLKELKKENARLKKLLAESQLHIDFLKAVASKNSLPWEMSHPRK